MSPKITRNCLRNVAKAQILLRQLFLPRYTCGLQRQLQDLVDVLQKHPGHFAEERGQHEKMIKMEPFLGPKMFLPRKKERQCFRYCSLFITCFSRYMSPSAGSGSVDLVVFSVRRKSKLPWKSSGHGWCAWRRIVVPRSKVGFFLVDSRGS